MNWILDKLFKKREIRDCDGSIYMHRWFVFRGTRFAIYIHKFVRSDFERALHDHPWDFLVIPIWQGYIEHARKIDRLGYDVPVARRVYPVIGSRFRIAEFKHRVELIEMKPAWSIFFRFRKRRLWGFHTERGWEESVAWWHEHCEDDTTLPGQPKL